MSTGAGTASGLEKAPFPAKEGAVSDSEAGGGTQRGGVAEHLRQRDDRVDDLGAADGSPCPRCGRGAR